MSVGMQVSRAGDVTINGQGRTLNAVSNSLTLWYNTLILVAFIRFGLAANSNG